jgi:hypothetical protein
MVAKRIQFAVLILFTIVILFFTFFGETLYYATKPHVRITAPTLYTIDGERIVSIPHSAYFDGIVYLIEYEASFSVTLSRVRAVEVEVAEYRTWDNNYIVLSGLEARDTIVRSVDRELKDGEYVVIER